MDNRPQKLQFFRAAPHTCNYLANRTATNIFADPFFPKDKALYSKLVASGFRRSGEHLYQPYCFKCSECVLIRLPVNKFKSRRNQKRTWKNNQDLTVKQLTAEFNEEHFQLYTKYLSMRHPDGGMDHSSKDDYSNFLWSSWSETRLFEFRLDKKLIAVAVVDQLENAFSAVYTFFDPELQQRSLGKYAILYLIEQARLRAYSWLYLGYWIANCDKMKYKIEYQPAECFINEEWTELGTLDFAVRQN